MDYIVDLGHTSIINGSSIPTLRDEEEEEEQFQQRQRKCQRNLFRRLQIGNETTGEVQSFFVTSDFVPYTYKDYFDETPSLRSLNGLDLELFDYALNLTVLDCEFYQFMFDKKKGQEQG